MPSKREDMESRGSGKLRQSPSRADSGSRYQYHLGCLDLGPTHRQDMAASDVTKEEVGGICRFCSGSSVKLDSCTFSGCRLTF